MIEIIARDAAAPRPWLGGRMAAALSAGGVISLAVLMLSIGIRPDILAAVLTWRFALKVGVAAVSLAAAYWASAQLARPETRLRDVWLALVAAPALLAAGVAYELLTLPAGEWARHAVGSNARLCLALVPLLSIAPLLCMLGALRDAAPGSATTAGAAAGLLAGGAGATLYALHCTDDSPLFVALWYSAAVALVALAGAVMGRRLLRW